MLLFLFHVTFCIPQAAAKSGKLPVTTVMDLVIVTGPANRLLLTKEILDFCGVLPIYNTEVHPDTSNGNGTSGWHILGVDDITIAGHGPHRGFNDGISLRLNK